MILSELILRDLVQEKLKLGENTKTKSRWVSKRADSWPDSITSLVPVKFYEHFVLFRARNGAMECYSYWDVWNNFLGRASHERMPHIDFDEPSKHNQGRRWKD